MNIRWMLQAGAVFALQATSFASQSPRSKDDCSVAGSKPEPSSRCRAPPSTFMSDTFAHSSRFSASRTLTSRSASVDILEDAFAALAVLQNQYFDATQETWPTSIDWTAAVIQTIVAGMLKTLSASLDSAFSEDSGAKSNLVSVLYDQIIKFFFGQNQQEVLQEAFDDMQWVSLGWIEAATFAESYGQTNFPNAASGNNQTIPLDIDTALSTVPWYGTSWVAPFFNRSQSFWQSASVGWDTTLCHGGMNWNPRLEPYKNSITNELWIASSINMYLYVQNQSSASGPSRHEQAFLDAAMQGYQWLMMVNMTNSQGLFVDGYHVNKSIPNNVECDERNDMVYTYNQGVLLTGQRGLYVATSNSQYLDDGHQLVQSVIQATGWDGSAQNNSSSSTLPPWRGLGRGGILEDQCDADGTCSQDGQTFKAIFFHHLAAFCKPLDVKELHDFVDISNQDTLQQFQQDKAAHDSACGSYLSWVQFNAEAALETRDSAGRFGAWWGASRWGNALASGFQEDIAVKHSAVNTTDYRNSGTPKDSIWGLNSTWLSGGDGHGPVSIHVSLLKRAANDSDPNDRGRGRTVETQAGGIAVLRAWLELSNVPQDGQQ